MTWCSAQHTPHQIFWHVRDQANNPPPSMCDANGLLAHILASYRSTERPKSEVPEGSIRLNLYEVCRALESPAFNSIGEKLRDMVCYIGRRPEDQQPIPATTDRGARITAREVKLKVYLLVPSGDVAALTAASTAQSSQNALPRSSSVSGTTPPPRVDGASPRSPSVSGTPSSPRVEGADATYVRFATVIAFKLELERPPRFSITCTGSTLVPWLLAVKDKLHALLSAKTSPMSAQLRAASVVNGTLTTLVLQFPARRARSGTIAIFLTPRTTGLDVAFDVSARPPHKARVLLRDTHVVLRAQAYEQEAGRNVRNAAISLGKHIVTSAGLDVSDWEPAFDNSDEAIQRHIMCFPVADGLEKYVYVIGHRGREEWAFTPNTSTIRVQQHS